MYASDRGVISLYRSVSDKLARWHGDPMRKALLVTGARQVGKTFAIREFIRSTYESSLEIRGFRQLFPCFATHMKRYEVIYTVMKRRKGSRRFAFHPWDIDREGEQ